MILINFIILMQGLITLFMFMYHKLLVKVNIDILNYYLDFPYILLKAS